MEKKLINTHPVKRSKSIRPVINVLSTFILDSRLHKQNCKYNIEGEQKKKVHRAKFLNRHSSKSTRVIKLYFCQNDSPIRESFWQKDSLVTPILFEICLFRNLAECTFFLFTLYIYVKIITLVNTNDF